MPLHRRQRQPKSGSWFVDARAYFAGAGILRGLIFDHVLKAQVIILRCQGIATNHGILGEFLAQERENVN